MLFGVKRFLVGVAVGTMLTGAVGATATEFGHPELVRIFGGQTPVLYLADHPGVDFRWLCGYQFRSKNQRSLDGVKLLPGEGAWAWCQLDALGASTVTWNGSDFDVLLTSRRAIVVTNVRHPLGANKILWQRVATHPVR
jgi:hypothetical protein